MPRADLARPLRGHGPLGLLAIAVILLSGNLVGAVLVLLWAWLSRAPWEELGLVRPKSWVRTIVVGVVVGVGLKLLMKALVMPFLAAPAANAAYHDLVGNPAALPGMLVWVVFGGGFGEELIWRGFLFERLGKLPKPAILLATSLLFAAAHLWDQGPAGAEQALLTGLVFGATYLATGNLWLPMVMHAAFDVAAVLLIYFDLESTVAHLLIR
jgi:membrane protease YdiL (CAAX protease family)